MTDLVEHCNLIKGNIWAANTLLGISLDASINENTNKLEYLEHADISAKNIMHKFSKCRYVANTFRFDTAEGLKYYATLNVTDQQFISQELFTNKVIDKVGSGDCFMAGLIYGSNMQLQPQQIIDFAAGAAFNKLFIKGDATTSTVEEIKSSYLNYA